MAVQLAIRVSDDIKRELDALVAGGRYATPTQALRAALQSLLEAERARAIDQQIVDAYQRVPPTGDEEAWAAASGRDAIVEEWTAEACAALRVAVDC